MSQQENQDNGLFSMDTEPPKRENPYLKKNREKAKASKTSAPRRGAETEDGEGALGTAYVRRRTFSDWMFEHVKLVAAIATVLVVLSLVLITDVVGVVENMIFQSQQEEKELLTLNYIQGLSEKSEPVTWDDLDRFRRDESRASDSVTWMIDVKGGQYELWISGVSVNKKPSYVYLFDMRTGDKMVFGEDDLDTFLRDHTKK